MTRPLLIGTPAERHSKPLHRTMPCWSRRIVGGKVQYSLLVPHRLGGGIQSVDAFGPETSRADVALLLRERRRMLWGRSRDGESSEDQAPRKPRGRKAAKPAAPVESATAATPPQAVSASEPIDDRAPWDEEAENQRALAAEADAALESAIRKDMPDTAPEPEAGLVAEPVPPESIPPAVVDEALSSEPTAAAEADAGPDAAMGAETPAPTAEPQPARVLPDSILALEIEEVSPPEPATTDSTATPTPTVHADGQMGFGF